MDGSIATRESRFADALNESRRSLAEVEAMIPSDPAERDDVQALLGLAVLVIRTQIDVAVTMWNTSEAVVELTLGMATLRNTPPPALPDVPLMEGRPRVEITARVLSGLERSLGVSRNGNPINMEKELERISGPRWRPRKRRAAVAGILGPGVS